MYSMLINSLRKIIRQYPVKEKIMIVPSYVDGHALESYLTHEGLTLLNFRLITLFDLAKKMCSTTIMKKRLTVLNNTLGQMIIYQILETLSSEGKLAYFGVPFITPQISKVILRTIKEIRASGYRSDNWPYDRFSSSAKILDLYQILFQYEEYLVEKNLIDEAELYLLGRRINSKEDMAIYLIPSNIKMNGVELQFFLKKIKPKSIMIPFFYPDEIATANSSSIPIEDLDANSAGTEKKIFDFLYYRGIGPMDLPDLDVEFYQSYSESIEVREVLRAIVEKEIPYDQVQIFYTNPEPYSQYFFQLANLFSIPVTFHSGIQIKNSKPAKLLFSFLDWVNDQYKVSKLTSLIDSGNMHLELKEPMTVKEFSSVLRQSPIGWGRERYLTSIDLAIRESQRKAACTSCLKKQEYLKEIQYYQSIKDWITEIFSEIPPESQGKISLSAFAGGLKHLITKYTQIGEGDDLDEEGYQVIQETMEALERNTRIVVSLHEASSIIEDLVNEKRIHASEPHAGCLHVASYKKGIWINRPYTFIVGMDSQKFPGNATEGTVFLDAEKKPYKQLFTDSENHRIEQFRMLQLILSTKKKAIISYTFYDTVDQREKAPAPFLLQLYRLRERDIGKNYRDFYSSLGTKRTFIPGTRLVILDIGELFLFLSKKEGERLDLILIQNFPFLMNGLKVAEERKKKELNTYNGKVRVILEKIDPRINRGIILSSSKLERIAYCPYLYFLSDVLKIKPPKEMLYEPGRWMSPMDRGLLLHQIYEKFYKTFIDLSGQNDCALSYERHWPLLEKIANECLEEEKKNLATTSELIYEVEKREILESCQVFLAAEEKNYRGEIPSFFELAFGTRNNIHDVLGKVKAAELTLPDGEKISLQGKIDRVDRMPDDTLRIIDYKTGYSDEYREGKTFRYGQQIQHAIYALVLEKILAKNILYSHFKIGLSGYYFPTIQGQGKMVLYGPENRVQVLQIIEILLNIVSQGNFAMIQKPDDWMCKDFLDVMEQNEPISLEGKSGEAYLDHADFDFLRRLRQFE